MQGPKPPLDPYPYPRDPRSRPARAGLPDGIYVYVQDVDGTVYVLPDGPPLHSKLLGGARPARYAGDLRIEDFAVVDVTNLSGTFQFDSPGGLLGVASVLREAGLEVPENAVRLFPLDGSPPRILE